MSRTIDQGKEFQLGGEAGTQTWRQDDEAGLSGKNLENPKLHEGRIHSLLGRMALV